MIPIAIYHCNISIVSRGKGKSAVGAAAYRSGEKITNEWDGMTHDYTRKRGVVHTEIMLPPHVPPSFSDRAILWNSVELAEKAGNAQLAREIDTARPIELSREEQIRLVREYCSSQFVSKGMCVDFAIHDTDSGNLHCYIMLTMRPLNERGAWADISNEFLERAGSAERENAPEKPQPPKSPGLANLLMKYLSVQREKSRKYSQSWQRQHAADELKTVSQAVNFLAGRGISTLAELDASLSSVREKSDAIREGMKAAEKRMKELQKLIEYGENYLKYKPVHDELKTLKNGWTNKRDKYEEAHRAEVAELQNIRKCVEIAQRADQPEQTQTRAKRHDINR
ncbi:MAG: MobQ family relaxase [Eubacteriales bacterium]|nr:MobQ family relaxase [Eubacteriales bacterium]